MKLIYIGLLLFLLLICGQPILSQIPPVISSGGVNEYYAIMYSNSYGEYVKVPIDSIVERYPWEATPECIPLGANSRFFIFYSPREGELFKINIDMMGEVYPFDFPYLN